MAHILIKIPVTDRKRKQHIRMTDFRRHKDQIVLDVLPKAKELIVTKFGEPIFKLKQPAIHERIDYPRNMQSHYFAGGVHDGGTLFVRNSDFFRHMDAVLDSLTNRPRVHRVCVTWYGWPDFEIRKTRLSQRVEFERVVPDRRELYQSPSSQGGENAESRPDLRVVAGGGGS